MAVTYIGQGGAVSYAKPIQNAPGTAYGGSIGLIDKLFESNQTLTLWIGPSGDRDKYCFRVESGQIVVYEKGADGQLVRSDKNVQQVLQEVLGSDATPFYLHAVLTQLIELAKNGSLTTNCQISLSSLVERLNGNFTGQPPTPQQAKTKAKETITADQVNHQSTAITTDQAHRTTALSAMGTLKGLVEEYNKPDTTADRKTQVAAEINTQLAILNGQELAPLINRDAALKDLIAQAKTSAQTILNNETQRANVAQTAAADANKAAFKASINTLTLAQLTQIVQMAQSGQGTTNIGGKTYNATDVQSYVGDPAINSAIGARALTLITNDPRTALADVQRLAPYITLPNGQQLITFTTTETPPQTAVLLIKQNGDNYQILSNVHGLEDKGKLSIEQHSGKIYVRQDIDWAIDPKIEATVIQTGPTAAAGAADGSDLPDGFLTGLGITDKNHDGKVTFADIDTNGDGSIDADEARAAGISDKLFRAIDSNMNALGASGNGKVVLTELQRFYEVASWFASRTGMNLNQVLLLYRTCDLTNVVPGQVDDAFNQMKTAINGALAGAPLSMTNLADILQKCGYADFIRTSASAQLAGAPTINTEMVAQVLMKLILGSQASADAQKGTWGINAPLSKPFPANKEMTATNLMAFIKGQDLTDGASGTSATEQQDRLFGEMQRASDPLAYFNQHLDQLRDYPLANGLVADTLINQGKFDDAMPYIDKSGPRKQELLQKLVKAATAAPIATMADFDRVFGYILKLNPGLEQQQGLRSLILSALASPDANIRNAAYIGKFLAKIDKSVTIPGEATGEAFSNYVTEQLKNNVDINKFRTMVFISGERGESVRESADFDAAIAGLKGIINSTSGYTDEDKAKARFALAEVYNARANKNRQTNPLQALSDYYEAMQLLQQTYNAGRSASGPATAYYGDLANKAVAMMANIAFTAMGLKSTTGKVAIGGTEHDANWIFKKIVEMFPSTVTGTIVVQDPSGAQMTFENYTKFKQHLNQGGGGGGGHHHGAHDPDQIDV